MKTKFICAIVSLIFACGLSIDTRAMEGGLIAIINNEIITQKDLDDFINFMRVHLSAQYPKEEVEQRIDRMRPDLIDKLIEDRLILQAAHKENIVVDPNRIKARLEQMKRQHSSDAAFLNALSVQGLTLADVELKIREQFLMADIIEKRVRSKIAVKPKEVTDYYSEHSQDLNKPEQRLVRLITIKDSKLAEQMQKSIDKYKDLDEIAAACSLEIIDLDWVTARQLKPEIADAIFALEKGSLWLYLDPPADSYVFEVSSIKPPQRMLLGEAQEEISNFLFERKMQAALVQWLDELRAQAYIEVKNTYGTD